MKKSKAKSQKLLLESELNEGGVYFNTQGNLIQIKKLNSKTKEMDIFNISEQYMSYFIKISDHNFIKRVR